MPGTRTKWKGCYLLLSWLIHPQGIVFLEAIFTNQNTAIIQNNYVVRIGQAIDTAAFSIGNTTAIG